MGEVGTLIYKADLFPVAFLGAIVFVILRAVYRIRKFKKGEITLEQLEKQLEEEREKWKYMTDPSYSSLLGNIYRRDDD